MPVITARRPSGLADSLRTLLSGSDDASLTDLIAVDKARADIGYRNAMTERVRQEIESQREADAAARQAAAVRSDPARATEFAALGSGLTVPQGAGLADYIRGRDFQADNATRVDDEGNPLPSAVAVRPDVSPEQERGFRSAMQALLGSRLATGTTNADQLAHAAGRLQNNALTAEATAPGMSTTDRNIRIAAASGKIMEPFKTNAQGTVLNEYEGGLNEGGELAKTVREANAALAVQRRAAAGKEGSHARLYDAETRRTDAAVDAPAPAGGDGSDNQEEVRRQRARKLKLENDAKEDQVARDRSRSASLAEARRQGGKLGAWVPGKGWEVKKGDKVIGYGMVR